MAFVNAGIKEIYIAAGGAAFPALSAKTDTTIDLPSPLPSAASCYDNIKGFGLRDEANLEISAMNQTQVGLQGLKFPNMLNFKITAATYQVDDFALLSMLIAGLKSGELTAALVSAGAAKVASDVVSANGGIYAFSGIAKGIGVDFELNITMKERKLTFTLERAYKYDDGLQKITTAGGSKLYFAADKLPMIDATPVIKGYVVPSALIPATLSTGFEDINIADWSIKISSQGAKNGFNMSRTRRLNVEMMISAENNDIAQMGNVMVGEVITSDLTVDIGTNNLVFKAKSLSREGGVTIGDSSRNSKITYTGSYDVDFVSASGANVTFGTFLS